MTLDALAEFVLMPPENLRMPGAFVVEDFDDAELEEELDTGEQETVMACLERHPNPRASLAKRKPNGF